MTFEESIVIGADAASLFWRTQDYARRLEWDPFLKSAELLGGETEPAVGVRSLCISTSGIAMETEYVTFNPPRCTAICMTKGPWFLESFAGSWRFESKCPESTTVVFQYSIRTKPRWLSWLFTPVLLFQFRRDMRSRLAALQQAVETARLPPQRKHL